MLTNMSLAMAAASADTPFIQVFVVGFGTVFVGLIALILIITLLGKIMAGSAAKEAQKAVAAAPQSVAPAAPVQQSADRQGMVAAISAAIATVMGEDVSAIRILSIKKVND